jgi:thiamine-monophosphate kinase
VTRQLDVRELGELGLIQAIRRRVGAVGGSWTQGIGDDAAILRPRAGRELVVTTDALIEDVHFRFRTTDARSLGHKSLAVSLSDLGAMGARPLGFVATLALPRTTPAQRLGGFLDGLLAEARSSDCPLVGGDTVEGPVWAVTVTAFGEVRRGRALLRGGGRPSDRLVVSGELGASGLGLALLERGGRPPRGAERFIRRQLRPCPPYRLGAQLAELSLATAAIDLSDGLARDLGHLLRESRVGADVHLDRLPLPRRFVSMCAQLGLDPLGLALNTGEDYELLFTLAPAAPSVEQLSRRFRVRLTEIGRLRRGRGARYFRGDRPVPVPETGFSHFAAPRRIKAPKPSAEK